MNLGRNGHFTDLTIDQWLMNEPRSVEVTQHFETCEGCRLAVEKIGREVIVIPPFTGKAGSVVEEVSNKEERGSRYTKIRIAMVGLASVLGVLLITQMYSKTPHTGSPLDRPAEIIDGSDGVRIKGASFSSLLYAKNAEDVRPLNNGSIVHPGERIGFRIENKKKGYLAIMGIDETGESYVCFPQRSESAQLIDAGEERTLSEAIRLDSKLGQERIISVFCETPFSLDELREKVEHESKRNSEDMFPTLLPNCEQREVSLEKK